MRKYIWDLFHTANIALGPIPPLQYFKWDLFHLCNISSGTYSTFSIFQVGPIPQSQKSFWDLFHSLNFFFKHHRWNRSQLEVEKVPIILEPIPPPIGTYSTLKLCGTNSTIRKKWDLFHSQINFRTNSALSQNMLGPIPPCVNTFGTYSTL